MESLEHNWANNYLRDNLPRNAGFWQVDLLDVVLSEYPDESHNFTNLFFTHHFLELYYFSHKELKHIINFHLCGAYTL